MSDRLVWKIQLQEARTVVSLDGPVNEDADLGVLASELKGRTHIRFDLAGVSRINSCGVREWVNFLRSLQGVTDVELEKCTPAVVSQLNMISNFAGSARVLSVHAPFVCDGCGAQEDVLVTLQPGEVPKLVEMACKACGQLMEFDDVKESYFAFIH